jgi:hypothetical protein
MNKPAERRHVARLTVPAQLSGPRLGPRQVRLLELSPEGARTEHPDPLNEGLMCFIDLPPDLGHVRLTGRVVWTKLRRREQTLEGDRQLYYQSGLIWTGLTPEQRSALAIALNKLHAMGDAPHAEPRRETSEAE